MTEEKKIRMREEAIERIKMLDFHPNVLKDFERGVVNYSERTQLGGILYWLSNKPEWEKKVKDFENNYNCLVYHATHEHTFEGDEFLTCLYVSSDEETWPYDKADIRHKENGTFNPIARVINLTFPEYSEGGGVVLKEAGGGLIRIA